MKFVMRHQHAMLLLLIALGACRSRASDAGSAVSVDTQSARQSPAVAADSNGEGERRTSGTWDPLNAGELPKPRSRFDVAADLYASGRLLLTLDTIWPRVETERSESTRTVADSLVVIGISTDDTWSNNCTRSGRYDGFIVGVIPNSATAPVAAQRAWIIDTVSYRIRAISTSSILCSQLSD
jgi:hypothetical protein